MALTAPAFAETAAPSPPVEQGKTKAKDKAGDAAGVVCTRETPTGSMFPVKVCTTAEQRNAQRKGAQRVQERVQGGSSTIPN